MTETLKDRISRHEGFSAIPRIDVSPMWVIGFGHDITEFAAKNDYPNGISYDDAEKFLESDIATAKISVARELPWTLGMDDARLSALIELAFWIGIGGLMKFTHMLTAMRNQDWSMAANQLLDSLLHKQIPARAEELANIVLNGYSDS